jgi:hypothetical protein
MSCTDTLLYVQSVMSARHFHQPLCFVFVKQERVVTHDVTTSELEHLSGDGFAPRTLFFFHVAGE